MTGADTSFGVDTSFLCALYQTQDNSERAIENGSVVVAEVDWMNPLILAERISKARTCTGGHRSFDMLHVAAALEMEADTFLSFDGNLNRLAASEGLATPLAPHSPET